MNQEQTLTREVLRWIQSLVRRQMREGVRPEDEFAWGRGNSDSGNVRV